MKKQIVRLLLTSATAFALTGCATGHHSTAYDYKVVAGHISSYPNNPSLQKLLDQASADGWQVVAAASDGDLPVVILKKAK